MAELRFDGRVAVITGGGRGLGRAYALLLASRGAKVVINDLGAAPAGTGFDASHAEKVLGEIKAAGGEAVVCTDSVATPQGGAAIVQAAMDHYGRIDILIHSAGNVRAASMSEMTQEEFDSVLDVHLRGAFHVVRPAFPLMNQAGYGRIVLTSSCSGVYGDPCLANYAVSKLGTIGLSNVVALEGAARNVKSNVILPGAKSRMGEGLVDFSTFPATMVPEVVAPAVAWLAHESCSISGEMLISMAGRVARAYVAESKGVYRDTWTIEQIADQMAAIRNNDAPIIFPVVPSGSADHISYNFGLAQKRANT
jgi:NAD(P)-dependent dehydrogenase (short-subunit alcohol dehydrogenase family)